MALINSTKNKGTSTTPSVAIPTGVVSNVIIILGITLDTPDDASALWPAGFTNIGGTTSIGSAFNFAWKRATGSESGTYTMSAYGSSVTFRMFAQSFSGRHITDPPVAGSVNYGLSGSMSSGGNVIANGVTTVSGDDLDLFTSLNYDASQAAVSWSWPGSPAFTQDEEESSAVWVPFASSVSANVGAGATGNLTSIPTWSGGTAAWAAQLIRIPAAPGSSNLLMGQILT